MYIYIYIYIHREREREIYIYIYICNIMKGKMATLKRICVQNARAAGLLFTAYVLPS